MREGRDNSPTSRFSANLFWRAYRALIMKDIPKGGMDVFGCNRRVRDELLKLQEANSSLIGLVIWLGFRRAEVGYHRRARAFGKSAWTFRKKLTYLLDSVFSFTDLPVRILTLIGLIGTFVRAHLRACGHPVALRRQHPNSRLCRDGDPDQLLRGVEHARRRAGRGVCLARL